MNPPLASWQTVLWLVAALVVVPAPARPANLDSPVLGFELSPDGQRVVYATLGSPNQLRSIPIGGGTPTILCSTTTFGSNGYFGAPLSFTPDSQMVVFRTYVSGEGWRLRRVPVAGPETSGAYLSPAYAVGSLGGSAISPDGSRVVYRLCTGGSCEIFSVPITGTWEDALRINGDAVEGGDAGGFLISPDSSSVVYAADQETDGLWEIWTVPIDGPPSSSARVSGTAPSGNSIDGVGDGWFTGDGSRVIYSGELRVADVHELFSSPLPPVGGESVRLHPTLHFGLLDYPVPALNGDWAVFYARESGAAWRSLWSVPVVGPEGAARKLSGDVFNPGNDPLVSPDGQYVLIHAALDAPAEFNLYTTPAEGPAEDIVRLDTMLDEPSYAEAYAFTNDSSRIVFGIERYDGENSTEWYVSPADGSAPAMQLGSEACLLQHAPYPPLIVLPDDRGVVSGCSSLDGGALSVLSLTRLGGPLDLSRLPLAEAPRFDTDFGFLPDVQVTSDGDWLVFVAWESGTRNLTAIRLPQFWDGFESGGTAAWSATEP